MTDLADLRQSFLSLISRISLIKSDFNGSFFLADLADFADKYLFAGLFFSQIFADFADHLLVA